MSGPRVNASMTLFARTFVIGVAVAAPVGAMGLLCVQRTLARGWRAGLATGLGIATGDAIYASIAAFGITALSSALVTWQTPLRLVGGAVLLYLGARSMLSKQSERCEETPAEKTAAPRAHSLYASAVGLTPTNPMTIMAFGAVFASAGLTSGPDPRLAYIVTAGVASGSLAWWVALTAGVALARHGLGDSLVRWVTRLSGAVIAGFGVLAIVSVFV